ncbi:MAG: alpha/beta hydrolase [Rhizobiaceae bacterium]|nr:alpha/beta hydrolase [Rhizobiaceae bacterium]MCV0408314.1 alpha/beta hydrolase [Rhizobiaceae bacterium]
MLFAGFEERSFRLDEVEIFARTAGEGAPLLLLHGYPQTGAMWNRIAGRLADSFRVVVPDLRGYGRSSCPPNDADNRAYSKRTMAADMVRLMHELGHERFLVAGHDRGGRVGYRMALDHPERVAALSVLDIVPTQAMWAGMDLKLGMKAYHWLMLAQPYPLPERLIGADPVWYLDWTIASWTKRKSLDGFETEALAEYRASFSDPDHLHASCNDYRAGRTFDLAADEADLAAGRKIACPVQALWGAAGFPADTGTPLDAWKPWCAGSLEGRAIDAGHFIVEENPDDTLAALLPFLEKSRELLR